LGCDIFFTEKESNIYKGMAVCDMSNGGPVTTSAFFHDLSSNEGKSQPACSSVAL
jgi:hypothetical protein